MRILTYSLIAVVSFILFIAIFAPARPIYALLQKDVEKSVPELKVTRVNGTIWNGETEVQFRQFPSSLISWQLSASKLLAGIASVRLTASGEGHELKANGEINQEQLRIIDLHGNINSTYVNHVSEAFGLLFSGNLVIEKLSLSINQSLLNSGNLPNTSGVAHWSGGQILFDNGQQMQSVLLPPLDASLYEQQAEQTLMLDVTHQQQQLLNISLNKSGWATVTIKARLFDLAQLPLPADANLDETILQLDEKIL